ncbi:transposase [Arthrospira platensis C1]|nr:transposase [Arthrospira platensis C1]BAI92367.1 hypothetical protein NIES39_L02070 [Arthrospira platensis NIES-39]
MAYSVIQSNDLVAYEDLNKNSDAFPHLAERQVGVKELPI